MDENALPLQLFDCVFVLYVRVLFGVQLCKLFLNSGDLGLPLAMINIDFQCHAPALYRRLLLLWTLHRWVGEAQVQGRILSHPVEYGSQHVVRFPPLTQPSTNDLLHSTLLPFER